jgi:hypothetical protein
MNADVLVSPQGSIALFHILSADAERWVEDHVCGEQSWFGGALVVEHRYVGELASGMVEDGLAVEVLR